MKISTKNEKKMRCHKKILKNEKIKKKMRSGQPVYGLLVIPEGIEVNLLKIDIEIWMRSLISPFRTQNFRPLSKLRGNNAALFLNQSY